MPTPIEKAALLEYLQWNAQDAHKYYRYDYYRDNCSTRVRDALDRVLRGRWKQAVLAAPIAAPAPSGPIDPPVALGSRHHPICRSARRPSA